MSKKVLCVCAQGMNRSKYLAEYLSSKGYETKYGGINLFSPNKINKFVVRWAEVIVFCRPKHKYLFKTRFIHFGKKLVTLDVHDSPRKLLNKHPHIEGKDYWDIQKEITHPELRRQIDEYLPL